MTAWLNSDDAGGPSLWGGRLTRWPHVLESCAVLNLGPLGHPPHSPRLRSAVRCGTPKCRLRPARRRPLHGCAGAMRAGARRMEVMCAAALIPLAGCTIRVIPPADVRDPVSVFIADLGYHSSLLLPRPSGEIAEYAYGEWLWFAKNEDQWYRLFPVLCCPTRGALGRRNLDGPAEADAIRVRLGPEKLYRLEVERSAVAALLKRLDERFDSRADSRLHNPVVGLDFVHDPQQFCLLRTCNAKVAEWLRELGCAVHGIALDARFVVKANSTAGRGPD